MRKLLLILVLGLVISNLIYSQKDYFDYAFINSTYMDFIKKDSKNYFLDYRPVKLVLKQSYIDTVNKYFDSRDIIQLDSNDSGYTWIDSLLIGAVIMSDNDISRLKSLGSSGFVPRKTMNPDVSKNNDTVKILNKDQQYYCFSRPILSLNKDYVIIKVVLNKINSIQTNTFLYIRKNNKWICKSLLDYEEQIVLKG